MSLARLSAGAGYRYLLRDTCGGDAHREPGSSLVAYYAASGNPSGRWDGSGLTAMGLAAGGVVSEEQMAALFGAGRHPGSGQALGSPYRIYRPLRDRIGDAVAAHPPDLDGEERAAAVAAVTKRESARRTPVAVAGFDMTFTAPKSVSVWWALADPVTQQKILTAHRQAVTAALELVESRALFTRVGHNGCAQIPTRGLVAASFEHWDSRSHDPNLHTHVVVANKVQGEDAKWRSLDSRTLHHAAVAVSELYDDLLADRLTETLGVGWGWRDRGPRRTAAFEIDGIGENLLTEFSTRSRAITDHTQRAIDGFKKAHGRTPGRAETIRLRQHATRATRPPKTVLSLGELVEQWRDRAHRLTGRSPRNLIAAVTDPSRRVSVVGSGDGRGDDTTIQVDTLADEVDALADEVIASAMTRRSTWTRWNLTAEAARATRALRVATARERLELVDRVVDAAVARCVSLDVPDLFAVPAHYQRPDGASVFTRQGEQTFTTLQTLDAEDRLVASTRDQNAQPIPTHVIAEALAGSGRDDGTGDSGHIVRRLHRDQVEAVFSLASSGRRVEVLIGPAGTGKTAALHALKTVWETSFGSGSVLGLAPSATAAAELGAALGVACENTAKWLHESMAPQPGWRLHARQLVILDEASLADTATLDRLVSQVQAADAKLVLVGDPCQLSSVGAGGGFSLLAETTQPLELTALWRFRARWEANASRLLRAGDPAALDAYLNHDRVRSGTSEEMVDAAYASWRDASAAGLTAILLAADTGTVLALNTRAHDELVQSGEVTGRPVRLGDGSQAAVGDVVLTRSNNRRLTVPGHGFVRNGDLWRIEATHLDGAITVTHTHRESASLGDVPVARVWLPAAYVGRDVELGYACTIHRAQGVTVEQAHVIASPGMTRQAFYVALTRGRSSNHAYVATDDIDPSCDPVPDQAAGAREGLERILSTDGAQLSATQTLRNNHDRAGSLARLIPIRETLLADADRAHWSQALFHCGLNPAQARQVLDSPAAGPLFAALRRIHALGVNGEAALRWVIGQRPLPDSGDLAAVLRYRVNTLPELLPPDVGTPVDGASNVASPGLAAASQLALLEQSLTLRGAPDESRRVIAEIDERVTSRIEALTAAALADAPAWLGPDDPTHDGPTEHDLRDAGTWESAVAIVASFRDLQQVRSQTEAVPAVTGDRNTQRRARIARHAARTASRNSPRRHETRGTSR